MRRVVYRWAAAACRLTLLCTVVSAHAVPRTWNGSTDNNWQWPFNWSGNAVPGANDTALIGNAPNNGVLLNADAFDGVDDLTVIDGATLSTNGFRLRVDDGAGDGNTTVGVNSTVLVPVVAANPGLPGLDTDRLVVQDGGTFTSLGRTEVDNNARVDVGGKLASGGLIRVGDFTGAPGVGLINNGTITASALGFATELTLLRDDRKTLDLDGQFENGVVRATADAGLGGVAASTLTWRGALSDPFSGLMEIGRRDTIAFDGFWQLDGRLVFRGGDGTDAATIEAFQGNTSRFVAQPGASIEVTQGTAVIGNWIDVEGGTMTPASNTSVNFRNLTRFFNGGTLDLSGGNITISTRNQLVLTQPTIDLDGSGTGGFHTIDVGAGDPGGSAPQLSVEGDLTDPFDGTIHLGDNALFDLGGQTVLSAAATLDFGGSDVTMRISGQTTIDASLDLIQLADDTVVVFRSDAVLNINGSTTGGGVYRGDITNSGTLNLNTPTFAGGWGMQGTLHLEKLGGVDPVVNGVPIEIGAAIDGGVLSGDGVVNNDVTNANSGRIVPGTQTSAGRLTFPNTLDLVGGVTAMELGGPTPATQHDQLVGGTLNIGLGEELFLELIDGYLPTPYAVHVLADFGVLSGVFGGINNVVVPGTGTGLAVTYDYAAGDLLLRRAILGDANLNGLVEQGDLNAVLANWGQTGTTWATGDLDGSGFVDQSDLNVVLNNWGDDAAPDFRGTKLPEPAALAPLGLILVGRRHKRGTAAACPACRSSRSTHPSTQASRGTNLIVLPTPSTAAAVARRGSAA